MTGVFNINSEILDCLSEADHDQACRLLAESFPLNYESALRRFNFELRRTPRMRFIIVKKGPELIGLLCTVDRAFPYHGVNLSVKGLSYMAVLPSHRNFSVTNLIKEKLLSLLDKESDLSIGFARKAMDGYWYPYGFVGFTNFGEIHISTGKPRRNQNLLEAHRISTKDIDIVRSLHSETYAGMLGGFLRDEKLWSYYLEKAAINNLNLNSISKDGKIIGYFHSDKNHIYELACTSLSPAQILSFIADYVNSGDVIYEELVFHTGFTHPITAYLRKYTHRMISRFEWRGGHILRISSIEKLLYKIRQVIQSRLVFGNVRDFEIYLDNFIFIFVQQRLRIVLSTKNPNPSERLSASSWIRLIFGIMDPGELVELQNREILPLIRVMFPQESPQVPFIDQF